MAARLVENAGLEANPAGNAQSKLEEVPVGQPVKYFLVLEEGSPFSTKEEMEEIAMQESLPRVEAHVKGIGIKLPQYPVLVTGSSGYLGRCLCRVLQNMGCQVRGIDVRPGPYTTLVGSISEFDQLKEAAGDDCKYIFHSAALHAPNLDYYTESAFESVNVQGTLNVLQLAKDLGVLGLVFSSTTSLMISKDLKQAESTETIVLRNDTSNLAPRNVYGKTKLKAEELCLSSEGVNVGVLRCSRFFAEDVFNSDSSIENRKVVLQNGNVKCNELLSGVRAGVQDMVLAHLRCMEKLTSQPAGRTSPIKIGPLIVSAVSPLLEHDLCDFDAANRKLFDSLGWKLPTRIGRIYDSRPTWAALDVSPKISATSVLQDIATREDLTTREAVVLLQGFW